MATDDHWLDGRAILVEEDVYWIAGDRCRAPESNGAHIVGPTARLIDALHLSDSERIGGAVLDVHPNGAGSYPLTGQPVPSIFAAGYDADALASEWQSAGGVVSALRQATATSGQPA